MNEKSPAESTKLGEAKGAKASKTNRMSRPRAEIKKEHAAAQAEWKELDANTRKHAKEMEESITKNGGHLNGTSLKEKLEELVEKGYEMAAILLRELKDVKERLWRLELELVRNP